MHRLPVVLIIKGAELGHPKRSDIENKTGQRVSFKVRGPYAPDGLRKDTPTIFRNLITIFDVNADPFREESIECDERDRMINLDIRPWWMSMTEQ